ncbi:MAG: hypothetical protein ACLQJ7_07480 [Syntrophobacteraceae bacterium]
MEFNIQDLKKEDLNHLKRIMLTQCRDYEPWADMMMLGGAGDPGTDRFPLDLDEIESINITVGNEEGP